VFIPVRMTFSSGEHTSAPYARVLDLTARQLVAFEHEAGDMTEPFTAIASDLHRTVAAAFATQGASGASGQWTALSEQYAAWKSEKHAGLPILVGLRPTGPVHHRPQKRNTSQTYAVSGATMRSLLMPLQDALTWHIMPKRLAYTPTSEIAGYLQEGTQKMPARPPVDLSPAFLHSIDREFATWLSAIIKRNGL
jgi:hypothetical protein